MSRAGQPPVADYVGHMLQAIQRIKRYVAGMDQGGFLASEEKQDAVIRNIEILGEAANNIRQRYPDFATKHADIPWDDIYLMRNRVAHGYFSVDLEIVWKTIQSDLPELEQSVGSLLARLEVSARDA